jgi:hypothetical protein
MMTEQEVAARVRELMAESRMLEAGFVLSMLCRKPAAAGADVTDLVRGAFFAGAYFILDSIVRPLVNGDIDDESVIRLLAMMLKELARHGDTVCDTLETGLVH